MLTKALRKKAKPATPQGAKIPAKPKSSSRRLTEASPARSVALFLAEVFHQGGNAQCSQHDDQNPRNAHTQHRQATHLAHHYFNSRCGDRLCGLGSKPCHPIGDLLRGNHYPAGKVASTSKDEPPHRSRRMARCNVAPGAGSRTSKVAELRNAGRPLLRVRQPDRRQRADHAGHVQGELHLVTHLHALQQRR